MRTILQIREDIDKLTDKARRQYDDLADLHMELGAALWIENNKPVTPSYRTCRICRGRVRVETLRSMDNGAGGLTSACVDCYRD